jgi:hypothetical protein
MIPLVKTIIGGILLFLGRELNFLFAAGMGALIGLRLTSILPAQWPGYYDYIFIGLLALLAAMIAIINERAGYFVSGFLAGGYMFVEYYYPETLTIPTLPFILGGVAGALIIGFLTEWAVLVISSLLGAYYVASYFPLELNMQILVTAGLFIIGALTQAALWYMQKN